jgi:pilus assembly protein CpaF
MEPLEAVAADLRERLLADAGEREDPEGLPGRIRALVDREAGVLDEGRRAELAARIAERAFGLGPLEPLLADPTVEEVMVSGTAPAWVERGGRLERTDARFAREEDLRDAIERILAPLGRRVDDAEPLCDARLPDGSRVNVVLPPLALDGPALTIRRFRRTGFTPDELVANGTLTRPLAEFLARAVRARANVLVCGGAGSGKTTLLGLFLGLAQADAGRPADAVAAQARAHAIFVAKLGSEHASTLLAARRLAVALALAGQPTRATALLEEILPVATDRAADNTAERARIAADAAAVYSAAGDAPAARRWLERAGAGTTGKV